MTLARRLPVIGADPIPVGKILAVGRNYADHAAEMQAPADPVIFMKPTTALRLPGEDVVLPRDRGSVHHEVEILVALAHGGTHLTEADAARTIGAYGIGLDLTLRDVQAAAKAKGLPVDPGQGIRRRASGERVRPGRAHFRSPRPPFSVGS